MTIYIMLFAMLILQILSKS